MMRVNVIAGRLGAAAPVLGRLFGIALLLVAAPGTPARAVDLFDGQTRLVMVDDVGCIYCARWERDVQRGYEASPEGHFAPLVRMRMGSPELARFGRLTYTPTFLLILRGEEAGRIVGFGGADFFWADIDKLYAKAGFHADDAAPQPPTPPSGTRASLALPLAAVGHPGNTSPVAP